MEGGARVELGWRWGGGRFRHCIHECTFPSPAQGGCDALLQNSVAHSARSEDYQSIKRAMTKLSHRATMPARLQRARARSH